MLIYAQNCNFIAVSVCDVNVIKMWTITSVRKTCTENWKRSPQWQAMQTRGVQPNDSHGLCTVFALSLLCTVLHCLWQVASCSGSLDHIVVMGSRSYLCAVMFALSVHFVLSVNFALSLHFALSVNFALSVLFTLSLLLALSLHCLCTVCELCIGSELCTVCTLHYLCTRHCLCSLRCFCTVFALLWPIWVVDGLWRSLGCITHVFDAM